MSNNNVNTNTNTTNLNANQNNHQLVQTMSKDARVKLEQRISERAAVAKNKSSSSSYIRLKDEQSFKAIFTGNADEQMVDFSRDGTSAAVKRYNYKVLLLEDIDGNNVQANNPTTFSASKGMTLWGADLPEHSIFLVELNVR